RGDAARHQPHELRRLDAPGGAAGRAIARTLDHVRAALPRRADLLGRAGGRGRELPPALRAPRRHPRRALSGPRSCGRRIAGPVVAVSVVDLGRELRLVTQPDHAHLSGELLSLWRADGLPAHPRRAETLFAGREHDNGWREADAAPRWDAAAGRPRDFLTT